ncbi:hypothetical protein TRFO_18946 [Tritrichomonas foetus]|uniref:Raptor N-terminal CASPase-like domain-containing protein n=1 Tax=Tritrichomonas foetus TaxID=1144522 RepID=A0A1J4KK33_9EUKA|nr:hypothetical protein TRFO_18946 [Tritrichomonas foetus]|eukprot:OHT11579.1 hypothetical protein TRFO_18946 [Tritrichomonas foetus]
MKSKNLENQSNDWKTQIELLADQESSAPWNPYPDHYVNTRIPYDLYIPQISLTNPISQVICKITDDFATMQQYAFDEESLPPKVLCWNDCSALDIKMATKTVKNALRREYQSIISDVAIKFQSVSVGNRDHIPFDPEDSTAALLIYHVLDPTLSQKSRITPTVVQKTKSTNINSMKFSRSSPQLKRMYDSDNTYSPQYLQTIQQPPIQDDPDGLKRVADDIPENLPAIFIFDCSFAKKAVDILSSMHRDFIIFAATGQESLLYYPQLPCDLFTSCLLTPAKVALLWQSQSYSDIHSGLLSEIDIQYLIDILNDSEMANNMLLMLENALEAYVDKMVSEELDEKLYYQYFRRSPVQSRLFSNFLFAVRMMKSVSTRPMSVPVMPDLTYHPLWDSFDLQVDRALYSIKESLNPTPANIFSYKELLKEQLRKLETWLWFPTKRRPSPDELPFIVQLLADPEFFPAAIKFCSQYLQIAHDCAQTFLTTRAFPLLPNLMNNETLKDAQSIAYYSFVIVNCILVDKSLKEYFEDKVSFWLDHVKTDDIELQTASLCCLLLFSNSIGMIDLYRERNLEDFLETLVTHNSTNIRTLSHLILSEMGVPLALPVKKISSESAPLCRAAFVSRITTTMDLLKTDEHLRTELLYDLILSLNDPYPLVREEALIALSHAIRSEEPQFLSSLSSYLTEWRDDRANNPIITLLGHEIQILQYEPSVRVSERITEFLLYLCDKFDDNPSCEPLSSNIAYSCLTKISLPSTSTLNAPVFSANKMEGHAKLVGIPAFSPSGLFACGDCDGRIHAQVFGNEVMDYAFFNSRPINDKITQHFSPLANNESLRNPAHVAYMAYIDDSKLMAVSNKSQVVVIDANVQYDAACAFWMTPPDICPNVIVDYNYRTYQVLHTTGISLAHVYDLNTQQKIFDIRIPRNKTQNMKWLKPYSSLFYVAQDDFLIYDERSKNAVATVKGGGKNLVNCNCSIAMPLLLTSGFSNGDVSMIDMRTMTEVGTRYNCGAPIKQFDVHQHLPFAVGVAGQDLVSFSYEDEIIEPQVQDLPGGYSVADAFCLHLTEASCAVRSGKQIQCVIIDY